MFKNKQLKTIVLILFCFYSKNYSADIKSNLDALQEESKSKEVTLSDLPQFKAYTSYIPKKVLDVISKLKLTNFQVGWDSAKSVGIINAEANMLGSKSVIRLVVGKSSIIDKTDMTESLTKIAKDFQSATLAKTDPIVKQNITQAGLTYFSQKPAKEDKDKQKVQEELSTTGKKGPQEEIKTDAAIAANKTLSKEESKTKVQEEEKKITETKAELEKAKNEKGGILGKLSDLQVGISIVLPQGFNFGKLSNDLGFLDVIKFEEAAICLGTGFNDPIYGQVPPGFAVITKIGMVEPFTTINKFLTKISKNKINLQDTDLKLKGNITPYIGGSSLSLGLPGQIGFNLNNKRFVDTEKLNLYAILLPAPEGSGSSGISFGLSSGLNLYLDTINKDLNPLKFKAYFAIDTSASALLTGSMDGLLNLQPIGLPIKFGNVTLQTGLNPENIETLGLSDVGLAGEFDFGPKDQESKITAAFDVRLSGQQSNILAYGEIQPIGSKKQALGLSDILHLATSAYKNLGGSSNLFGENIPELGIKNAKFYFSPANVYFANKVWPAGINVNAGLDIFGTTAEVEFNINAKGFDGTGYLSPIKLGPIEITGAGKSKVCSTVDRCLNSCNEPIKAASTDVIKPGTLRDASKIEIKDEKNASLALKNRPDYSKEKGAILNLKFYPASKDIGLFLSADIIANLGNLGKLSADSCINISTNGIYVHFGANALNVFDTQFTLNTKDFKKPNDWYLCAKMQQDAIDLLQKEVSKLVASAKTKVGEKIESAQKDVDKARTKFNNAMDSVQSTLRDKQKIAGEIKAKLDQATKECGK